VIRFALLGLSAFAALTGAMLLSEARADSTGFAIAGHWTGKYICAQGITALRLDVVGGAGNAVSATFNFGPQPENPEVPVGAYAMRGTYDPVSRHLQLEGVTWLQAPSGYAMVGLDGRMSASGERISGRIPDLFTCTDFEVRRTAPLVG
jgi:hypothetical protein